MDRITILNIDFSKSLFLNIGGIMKKRSINIMFALIIMIFSISIMSKMFENDLFFDLKTGESILKYGIDFKDHFSFITNLTYIYHHWLYDLVIYFIYKFTGYTGLFVLFNLIFTLFGFLVFYINKKQTNKRLISLIITLFTMFISSYAFQSRVQSITYILFFLEIYFINQLYEQGNKKYSIYIIILSIFIANLHMPLWIFSVILFLPYIFEFVFKAIVDRTKMLKNIISDRVIIEYPVNKKTLIITFLLLLFTGLLTPLRLYPYTFFIKSLFNNSYLFIGEMSKTLLINFKWEIILVLIFIITIFIKNIKVKLRDLCLIVGLLVFSLIANRNVIYVYIFYPTIIIKIVCQSNKNYKINLKKIKKIFKNVNKKIVLVFSTVCLIFIYFYCLYDMDFGKFDYGISDMYPTESVKYIKENTDYKNIRLYNNFNYGSYLEFNDIPVFIDSRAEVYLKEFNGGNDVISDYLNTFNFSTYKEVFEKYQFNYALVYKESEVYYYLESDPEFEIIFEEESYTLFQKKESVSSNIDKSDN